MSSIINMEIPSNCHNCRLSQNDSDGKAAEGGNRVMYEELVKDLREVEEMLKVVQFKEATNLINQAAEAIEDLENKLNLWRQDKISRWIPVTERLPQSERKSYWVCTDTGYQCECRWTNSRFGIELDEWGWNIFDIPQYQKVVAWMPLLCPYEPPKEE